ncbi:MAG: hypothetical protein Kow0010_09770 [Dehalococcoidia bacterium]
MVPLLAASALAGCSGRLETTGGETTPIPGQTQPSGPPHPQDGDGSGSVVRPPGASLVTARGAFAGGIGTYCWREASEGLCLDFVGPVSNLEPIVVHAGEQVAIEYLAGTPAEAHIAWYAVDASAREPTAGGELLWKEHPPAFQEPVREDSLVAPSEPGEYLLTAFVVYPGKGDVSYGFYVVVE